MKFSIEKEFGSQIGKIWEGERFDNIETTSEPKIIYMDKTWYK